MTTKNTPNSSSRISIATVKRGYSLIPTTRSISVDKWNELQLVPNSAYVTGQMDKRRLAAASTPKSLHKLMSTHIGMSLVAHPAPAPEFLARLAHQ